MDPRIKKYLSEIGRRGGTRSRRKLTRSQSLEMLRVREARKAFRRFHTRCFWSTDPDYRITAKDVPWVAEQLMRHGDRESWRIGARLCH